MALVPEQISPTVVVACGDTSLLDEVARHIDEIQSWRLLATSTNLRSLIDALSEHRPQAVVISKELAREVVATEVIDIPAKVVVVGRAEEAASLRAALDIGAAGFLAWPADSPKLRGLIESGLQMQTSQGSSGSAVAVWSPKGGAGGTVVTAHLAAAISALESDCVVVDLDLSHGDLTAALGAESETKSVVDLLRVVSEITPASIDSVAFAHSSGFKAILSPASPGEAALVKPADLVEMVDSLRSNIQLLVVDLPSGLNEYSMAVAAQADRILMVVTADLLSLRRTREAIRMMAAAGVELDKVSIVLNRFYATRDISSEDVAAVLGRKVSASIPEDPGLLRAPNRGELARSSVHNLEPLARDLLKMPPVARKSLRSFLTRS